MPEPVKIAVLIPSRGRPERLAKVVLALKRLESGLNAVTYVIGADADDHQTIAASMDLWRAGLPVLPTVGPRSPSLGAIANRLAVKCPADVYTPLCDDTVVQTTGWDKKIAQAWRDDPNGVWWWSCVSGATCAIVSENWRAASGRLFTDYFPFWYDDIWLVEVQRYVTGRVGDRLDAWIADEAPGTTRMRDLPFWDDFFWSRRDERLAEAARIAGILGLPPVSDADALSLEKNPDFDAVALEAKQGDRRPPDPQYLLALERARAMMAAETPKAA